MPKHADGHKSQLQSLIISSLELQNDKSKMMFLYEVAANNAEGMYFACSWTDLAYEWFTMHAHLINAAYRIQVITN